MIKEIISETPDTLVPFLEKLDLKEKLPDISHWQELNQLVNQGWYGKLLNTFSSNHTFFKLIAWWFLYARNIYNSLREKRDLKESSKCCRDHLWPKNKSVLLDSKSTLKAVYSTDEFMTKIQIFNKVWAVLLGSLLINDIYYYYKYPELQYGNTLSKILSLQSDHSQILSKSLTSDFIWPELLVLPFTISLISAFIASYNSHSIPTNEIKKIRSAWKKYQSTFWLDGIRPILAKFTPNFLGKYCGLSIFPNSKYTFNNLMRTLLWDGRVSASDRHHLFTALKHLLKRSKKLTRFQLLKYFEAIAENIHPKDILRLHQSGYGENTIITLMRMQSDALHTLKQHAKPNFWNSLRYLYAHFLLWNIGQPKSKILQPFFWGWQAFRWYATMQFFTAIVQGIKYTIENYLARKNCESQGKLWIYVPRVSDFRCTICGDLPVSYKSIFDSQACFNNYFNNPAIGITHAQRMAFLKRQAGRIDYSQIKTVDISNQYFEKHEELKEVLDAIADCFPNIENFSSTKQISFIPANSSIAQPLSRIISRTQFKKLDWRYQNFANQSEFMHILGTHSASPVLKELHFIECRLGDDGIGALSSWLLNLKNLTYLNLENNHQNTGVNLFPILPNTTIVLLNLPNSNINYDGMQVLGQILPKASSLEILNLEGNTFGDSGAIELSKGLPGSNIKILKLPLCNIGIAGAKNLGPALGNSSVVELDMWGNNQLSNEGIDYLVEGFSYPNATIKKLNFEYIGIDDSALSKVGQVLPITPIEELNLALNAFSSEGIKNFTAYLNASSLRTLILDSNWLEQESIQYLSACLAHSPLTRLDLRINSLGSSEAKNLSVVLNNTNLRYLELSYNFLGDEGFSSLAEGLGGSLVESFYVKNNHIGPNGTIAFFQNLRNKTNIQKFYFNGYSLNPYIKNAIGDEGLKATGEAFQNLPALEILSVVNSNIGDEGLIYFSSNLPNFPFLKSLDFSWNRIGKSGLEALSIALPHTQNLTHIDFALNNLSDVDFSFFFEGVSKSPIQVLGLRNTGLKDSHALAIAQKLLKNEENFKLTWVSYLNPDFKRAIARNKPNTNLSALNLRDNQITNAGAEVLCTALPYSGISELDLRGNPIDNEGLKLYCVSSSATRLSLPFPFNLIEHFYKSMKRLVDKRESRQKPHPKRFMTEFEFGEGQPTSKDFVYPTDISYFPSDSHLSLLSSHPAATSPNQMLEENILAPSVVTMLFFCMMLFWLIKKLFGPADTVSKTNSNNRYHFFKSKNSSVQTKAAISKTTMLDLAC